MGGVPLLAVIAALYAPPTVSARQCARQRQGCRCDHDGFEGADILRSGKLESVTPTVTEELPACRRRAAHCASTQAEPRREGTR